MADVEKCNEILQKMIKAGYTGTVETCDGWTEDDIEYFLANYEEHYLTD